MYSVLVWESTLLLLCSVGCAHMTYLAWSVILAHCYELCLFGCIIVHALHTTHALFVYVYYAEPVCFRFLSFISTSTTFHLYCISLCCFYLVSFTFHSATTNHTPRHSLPVCVWYPLLSLVFDRVYLIHDRGA